MRSESDLAGLAISLAGMARDLLAQESVQDTLDRICVHAVELVDGCEDAGILLLHDGKQVETAAATSDRVVRSDEAQGRLGEGPCFDALDNREAINRIANMEAAVERWPRYAVEARELGFGSMIGFLLYTDEHHLGALNIYCREPNSFTEHSELVGWLLASHAAVALSAARTAAQLNTAIATRQAIGEALGIIMERYKLVEDDAFQLLRKVSQDRNIKVRELADTVVHSGDLPTSG